MKTPIRRLNGVSYWVIEDPEGIYDFINTELRREWEEDARSEGRNPKEDAWLKALPKLGWRLETTEMDRVKLDPEIMNYVDVKNGYTFQKSLASRSQELKETIERFASVIWPLIIKKEGYVLVDGYCRYTTLKAMNVSRTYTYVGSLP
jgi:hypothetical protein